MPGESVAVVETADVTDWQAVADELAGVLRTTMLRNPNLTARDWARAAAALDYYDVATRDVGAAAVETPSVR